MSNDEKKPPRELKKTEENGVKSSDVERKAPLEMKKIAGEEYPLVRQTLNTCGIASLSMIFLHHSKEIEDLLIDLFKRNYLGHKKSWPFKGKRDNALIWSEGYLLLRAAASRKYGNWLKTFTDEFQYDDFKLNIDLMFNSRIPSRILRRITDLETLIKYYQKGIIRKRFLLFYLNQFKTQLELKILASMFGFHFQPYPNDVMGLLFFEDDEEPEEKEKKVKFIEKMINKKDCDILFGHGQSHWMVAHSLYHVEEIDEYILGINDPLGPRGSTIPIKKLDHSYIFYFFKFNDDLFKANMKFLRENLHL
ncbi:MAG: hypothetical protein ACFFCS_14765 [Candidatus Hodarchaeota archaeon]